MSEGKGKEPSGYKGDNPSTAGPGKTDLHSTTPENADGELNPSAPGNAGTTPGSTGEKTSE
jgi:hypothetical protein